MKFNLDRPPVGRENTKEQLERLTSWLFYLCESLNVTLANLGEDNFSADAREKLFSHKEENNDNT